MQKQTIFTSKQYFEVNNIYKKTIFTSKQYLQELQVNNILK